MTHPPDDSAVPSASTLGSPRRVAQMQELTGLPIRAAAPANVMWLDTVRGAGVLLTLGALIWSLTPSGTPWVFLSVMVGTAGLDLLAWVSLRHMGRPLKFGPGGGAFAATDSMLFFAPVSQWTGRPKEPVQAWPREDVSLMSSSALGARRLLDVRFEDAGDWTRLEIRGRNKDAIIDALFGRR